MDQDNLTQSQKDYAVYLPALSGFYGTFVGKQRTNNDYVDPARFPQGLTNMEQMNWLNPNDGLFPYKWSLYSGGHANLDLTKPDAGEDMIRNRDPNSIILGDSGGFQIAKGLWEADWKANSGCPKAQAKREQVLKWLDGISTYGMVLDIPTWIVNFPDAAKKAGIRDHKDAVEATKFNNEYFIANRKGVAEGGAKFLNVLQGANHGEAEDWYQTMKGYCDPTKYPGRNFNGWGMGGQHTSDMELILKRFINLKYDGLLQQGQHDWIHFLGMSQLEWAVLFTVLQRALRKHVNPDVTISFDAASPFLATANGQVYYTNVYEDGGKWSYRMGPSADDKKYATDNRKWGDAVVQDGIYDTWTDSPISSMLKMSDICVYKPGVPKPGVVLTEENFKDPELYDVLPDLNKIGKWGKTSWDSFSYMMLMGHNVWMHLTAVQEANRRFDAGERPGMMTYARSVDREKFEDLVEQIFSAPTREESLQIIKDYTEYWKEIVGGRGYRGKKSLNSTTNFNLLFTVEHPTTEVEDLDEDKLDELEGSQE
jgi:hypothetical protein